MSNSTRQLLFSASVVKYSSDSDDQMFAEFATEEEARQWIKGQRCYGYGNGKINNKAVNG